MGSFNYTCVVSGLPIEADTKVRYLALARSAYCPDGNDYVCYVGGRWELYGVPIRSEYNDYGSIELDATEETVAFRVFFEILNRSAIEKGVGDNTSHDVEVRSGMNPEAWLEALWEGRVFVRDLRLHGLPKVEPLPEELEGLPKYEPPEGVPSIRRISQVLTDAGLPVGSKGYEEYMVDELAPGYIRVRRERFGSDQLAPALPLIHAAGYAAMITVGSGSYASAAEILVAPQPSTDPNRHVHLSNMGGKPDYHRPRPVSQAMIREDVWQILVGLTVEWWSGAFTIEDMRKDALRTLEEYRADEVEKAAIKALPEGEARLKAELKRFHQELRELDAPTKNRFSAYMQSREGTSGVSREIFRIGMKMAQSPEEQEAFVLDMAETLFVESAYAYLYGQWHPTSNSRQDSPWESLSEYHTKLAAIRGRLEDE